MTEKNEYLEQLNKLQNYHDFALDISEATAGKKNIPWHLVRGHQLFNRLNMTCLSAIRLMPYNRQFPTDRVFWDFFSIASLTRNFVENYYALFYIAVDSIESPEREFRLLLLTFHLNNEKYKFFNECDPSDPLLKDFETNLPIDKQKLQAHPFFKKLDKQKQNGVLKGVRAKYLSNDEIAKRIGHDTSEFKPLYRFFSNQVHSTPWAFYTQSNIRGRGLENEVELAYTTTAIQLITKYLMAAILDMTALFPECLDLIDKRKLKTITADFKRFSTAEL
ncbi:DUF5677 domain-containing protein [Fulvivirga ulvae]|uniref:DUF5677 domain-containing protein n=1 Tax=Fulvivirga ulvae TaxID=2904245 RepID=UPI001F24190F|nr:DUF5677 domain-containing protein [Fulvivirga ulvae]UII32157.1 DUF5677 domain-containing protein [Fulvivirga ulvae]